MKVLIVDDSELLLDRVVNLLADIDNLEIVGTVQNSLLGEELVDELEPDLVISDIHMPGGGGFTLLEHVKENHPEVIMCVYTNYPHEQYREKAMELGADYFFHKSSETNKLYETISYYC